MSGHVHHFTHWPFAEPVATLSFCTAHVAHEGYPVLRVSHAPDGEWEFYDDTTELPGECVVLCLGCVYEADQTLAEVSDLPRGWSAARNAVGAVWDRWEREPDEDEDEDADDAGAAPAHQCDRSPEAIQKSEQKALDDIATYGLHVISVQGDDEHLPFTYSLGIEQSLGMPELIIIGLRSSLAHGMINACYERMKAGLQLAPGMRVDGLLGDGFQCVVVQVSPEHFADYMGWAIWLHKGRNFRALQIVFPSVNSNRYPWEPEVAAGSAGWQPVLSSSPPI